MKRIIIIMVLCIAANFLSAQIPPHQTNSLDQAKKSLSKRFSEHTKEGNLDPEYHVSNIGEHYRSGIGNLSNLKEHCRTASSKSWMGTAHSTRDTLIIGFEPGEEVVVSGVWFHSGPIIILNDGRLRFHKADATILGDIIIVGDGQMTADSSSLHFPQEYFYQRELLLTDRAELRVENSILDFGGLVNNMAAIGQAKFILKNVEKPDFSTVALFESSSFEIDGIDVAGEFIADDAVNIDIRNAEMVLIWHRFPESSVAEISFPNGDFVDQYSFNNSLPDVNGIEYNVALEKCEVVWWGIMPSSQSDLTINNSKLRTVGLFFEGSDSTEVKNLVNNSNYEDFTTPLSDRNLRLINSSVQSWSLYAFDETYILPSSCILGEVAAMGRSKIESSFYFCDGSGGYVWGTDTSFVLNGFSALSSSLRSSGQAIVLLAYSSLINGQIAALEQSILMVIQSEYGGDIFRDPEAAVWNMHIDMPGQFIVDAENSIKGSTWIERNEGSNWAAFDYYEMYWQKTTDTNTWNQIGPKRFDPVYTNELANWSTTGYAPGTYLLKLVMYDANGFFMEALQSVTLLPGIYGTEEVDNASELLNIYPNPSSGDIQLGVVHSKKSNLIITIYDILGHEVLRLSDDYKNASYYAYKIRRGTLKSGIYICTVNSGGKVSSSKMIIR